MAVEYTQALQRMNEIHAFSCQYLINVQSLKKMEKLFKNSFFSAPVVVLVDIVCLLIFLSNN